MSCSLDLGYWCLPDGRRALLCWNPHNGQLVLHHPNLRNDVLGVIYSEPELHRRLKGWADHAGTRDGLGWLAQQLEGCR